MFNCYYKILVIIYKLWFSNRRVYAGVTQTEGRRRKDGLQKDSPTNWTDRQLLTLTVITRIYRFVVIAIRSMSWSMLNVASHLRKKQHKAGFYAIIIASYQTSCNKPQGKLTGFRFKSRSCKFVFVYPKHYHTKQLKMNRPYVLLFYGHFPKN